MIEACLLGTGGMLPLPDRWLSSLLLRHDGMSVLVDCGEGTQIAMKRQGYSAKPIEAICFTHFHADHISGLPGMLLTMGNSDRTEPLWLIGPKGLEQVVRALRVIAPELPFELHFCELDGDFHSIALRDCALEAFRVAHTVECYGFSLVLNRPGRFLPERALELGIPKPLWGRLQRGERVSDAGRRFSPDMVMTGPRRGLKLTYCTDTRPVPEIARRAAHADLLILEGMYGAPEKAAKAALNRHMTMVEAAELAAQAHAGALWLTHYSPSMPDPEPYMDAVRAVFPGAIAARDGQRAVLRFSDGPEISENHQDFGA